MITASNPRSLPLELGSMLRIIICDAVFLSQQSNNCAGGIDVSVCIRKDKGPMIVGL